MPHAATEGLAGVIINRSRRTVTILQTPRGPVVGLTGPILWLGCEAACGGPGRSYGLLFGAQLAQRIWVTSAAIAGISEWSIFRKPPPPQEPSDSGAARKTAKSEPKAKRG